MLLVFFRRFNFWSTPERPPTYNISLGLGLAHVSNVMDACADHEI